MILMAVDEPEHERELSSNISTKKFDPVASGLPVKEEKVVRSESWRKNQGMAAERPPEVIAEYTSGGDDTGEGMHGVAQPGKSGGERRRIRRLLAPINAHQLWTEIGRTGSSEVQLLSSMLQRVPPRRLVPSKLF